MLKQQSFPAYKTVNIETLIPYARNSRTHSPEQIDKIAASIKEFGFLNPIIIDGDNGIIAGHGRVIAAKKVGLTELPVIEASHLTEAQRRAYVIADNRIALDAGWDDEMLRVEFAELESLGFDLDLTGFAPEEIEGINLGSQTEKDENIYTQKVDAPHYEVKGEKPSFEDMYDPSKSLGLIEDIKNSSLDEKEKAFLMSAASRHIVFNFENIAEYYAHASSECQKLMEDSALVIIDFDKAISHGYVKLNERLNDIFSDRFIRYANLTTQA